MSLTDFLDRLKGVKQSGDGWQARCPAHEDAKASLSIAAGKDGRILLKCFAGCSVESVVGAVGLKVSDLFSARTDVIKNKQKPREVAAYDYTDENGVLLFQTVRLEPKDFKQRRPDPAKSGQWLWNLKGVCRVLYRLPEVKSALAAGTPIFVAEGEKDVDALVKHGCAATCNPLGAKLNGNTWLPEHTETLRGAALVVVIADKDQTGRCHARVVANTLHGVAQHVKLIELPDRGEVKVKDAADFFAAGGTANELRAVVDDAPEFAPTVKAIPVGQAGQLSSSPAQWFAKKFPSLAGEYGTAILEETKDEIVAAKDICEDFFAASLGHNGSPDAPTVFAATEDKFYTYTPADGIFTHQREPVLITRLSRLLLDCARDCQVGCDTKTLEFRFRDSANLSGILKKARSLVAVPHDFFASNLAEFIPCANGMLRLDDKTLLPFNPSYRRRNKLAVPFYPAATCPLFLDTLMRQALDEADLDLLQRWCGLALVGENLAQKILILTGTAGGGKGTFIRVLSGIIGEINLASLRTHLLGERFELGRFLGKTLLYGADVPEDFLNQRGASVLKSLTGADPVTLEFKNSNESPAIICKFNVVATCNSRLTVRLEGDTDAWRRRLGIIEYNRPKPEKVIADLDTQILTHEASGVLNWMLVGLDKLRADGWQLKLTGHQQERVDNLLLESDGHTVFASERLIREASQSVMAPDCYAAYVEFCFERGWNALTKNKFGAVIADVVVRQFGITQCHNLSDNGGKAQRGWRGIGLIGKFSQPTAKPASQVSQDQFRDGWDEPAPVQPEKNLVEEIA